MKGAHLHFHVNCVQSPNTKSSQFRIFPIHTYRCALMMGAYSMLIGLVLVHGPLCASHGVYRYRGYVYCIIYMYMYTRASIHVNTCVCIYIYTCRFGVIEFSAHAGILRHSIACRSMTEDSATTPSHKGHTGPFCRWLHVAGRGGSI